MRNNWCFTWTYKTIRKPAPNIHTCTPTKYSLHIRQQYTTCINRKKDFQFITDSSKIQWVWVIYFEGIIRLPDWKVTSALWKNCRVLCRIVLINWMWQVEALVSGQGKLYKLKFNNRSHVMTFIILKCFQSQNLVMN